MTEAAVAVNLSLLWGGRFGAPPRPSPRRGSRGPRRPEPSFVRLWDAARSLDAGALDAGRHWYREAQWRLRGIADANDIPTPIVIAAAAALSPGLRWERVLWLLRVLIEAQQIGAPIPRGGDATFGFRDRQKAWEILRTGDTTHCRGDKVEAFRRALGGDMTAVVVDRHLIRLATGRDVVKSMTTNDKGRIRAALWTIAWSMREQPAHLQAALWSASVRTEVPSKPIDSDAA